LKESAGKEFAWRQFMGEFSIFHWLIVLAIVLIFFGGRRIPEVMKGLGEGIRSFKDGMSGSQTQAPQTFVAAPSGLTAKSGGGEVVLNWSASPGAGTYNVKRSGTSGGPYARIASTSATNYTDGGLVGGTTFYYVVSSTNSSGESENSLEVSATPA
jgi:TatA/E family protein of Tat protein translocase